jgi:hypothetical protein
LGMRKAQSGAVRVFGLDPVVHPVEVLAPSVICQRIATCRTGCECAS